VGDVPFICFVFWEEDFSFSHFIIIDKRLILNNLFSFSISVLDSITSCSYSPRKNTGVIYITTHLVGILSKMPLSNLLTSRSKTDPAKQLKEFFTVIENEHDKEKKNYEEVNKVSFDYNNFIL
jgi:hypothetical protein